MIKGLMHDPIFLAGRSEVATKEDLQVAQDLLDTLIGSKDDYKVDVEKGLGSISVDGKNVSDLGNSGNGQRHIHIEGGIGAVRIVFRED